MGHPISTLDAESPTEVEHCGKGARGFRMRSTPVGRRASDRSTAAAAACPQATGAAPHIENSPPLRTSCSCSTRSVRHREEEAAPKDRLPPHAKLRAPRWTHNFEVRRALPHQAISATARGGGGGPEGGGRRTS
eukprot:CAMPEP_0205860688 /NCGR_PEP_ID=MMETSP1083-20121108/5364_1 /ASSEMBLY_ACC=CAM_ASM_000430 /TAXON_ID=97485 /ORGANISM="Prymnesium parvum, Strain Texoma1" /LENGTH=133 /DNA_ID=CAMNT_0053222331 /DNA_START=18 /DNA_END=420 /DNA_ORIENTATION=+